MKLIIKDKERFTKLAFNIIILSSMMIFISSLLLFLLIPDFDGTLLTIYFTETVNSLQFIVYLGLSSQILMFFCINRISLFLEREEGREFNETIMKVKKSSGVGFIFGAFMIFTFFMVSSIRFDLIANVYVYNANGARDQGLLDNHVIYAAVWVLLFGTFYMLGIIFTNFYFGRLISYYANQKNAIKKSRKWQVIQVFGILWSLQFLLSYLLPVMIGLIVHGFFTGIFCLAIKSLSSEDLKEIKFSSILAEGIKDKDIKSINKKFFERIIQVSMVFCLVLIGTLWFGSTFLYSRHKLWYDWGFYLFLGIIFLSFPILSLVHAKQSSSHLILKGFFLVISLISFLYLALSIFSYTELLTDYIFTIFFNGKLNYLQLADGFLFKPGQFMLLFLLFFTSMISLIGLKKGLLPLKKGERRSIKHYLKIKNLQKPTKIFLFFISGMIIMTFLSVEGVGGNVVLTNDQTFRPRISFWEWDGEWDDHDDPTLDKLANYSMNLYGGYGRSEPYKSQMEKYYDRGILVRVTGDNHEWIDWIEEQRAKGWNKCPVDGFIEDIEDGGTLNGFNRYQNELERSEYEELIDYAHRHGFSQHFTAMHTTINDQRDGDLDMSIFHQIHSVPPLDWDSWNWMLYRTEDATHYEEQSPYFTYLWVKEMKDTFNEIYGTKYDDKLSVSLGVISKDRGLYAASDGLDQLIWDMRICDALEIPEIIIFILNPVDGNNFLGLWGLQGLNRIYNELNNWDILTLPYSRSATFYGNIKYLENPTGSVFGNYWLDLFLDNGLIFLALAWIICQSITYMVYIKKCLEAAKLKLPE